MRGIPYGEARGRRTECAVQAVRFGNVASPVQSSFLGIVPVDVYCQICILKKYCHADCGRRTLWGESAPDGCGTLVGARERQTVAEPLLGRESARRAHNHCWGESAPDGCRTLVGAREHQTGAEPLLRRGRTRRSQNPCWGARAPTLIGARTQTVGAGHFEARTDGATLRRTTRQVLLNQR